MDWIQESRAGECAKLQTSLSVGSTISLGGKEGEQKAARKGCLLKIWVRTLKLDHMAES